MERFEDLPDVREGIRRAVKRHAEKQAALPLVGADPQDDPTFEIRRKQANLCEAVMLRVIELETAGKAMLESAKKLRAAVVANT